MHKGMIRAASVAAMVALMGATAACDRQDDQDDHHHVGEVHILDRATTPHAVIAIWDHDDGWDTDNLLTMSHSERDDRTRVSLGARFYDRAGREIELGGQYTLRYGVVPGSDPDGVIDMDHEDDFIFHGDHVHIYSDNETRPTGTADVVFALWHGDHSDDQTDPVQITVTD